MIWHRLRAHKIEAYRCTDLRYPWRWQCSCGRIWGRPHGR